MTDPHEPTPREKRVLPPALPALEDPVQKDVVCGMNVSSQARDKMEWQGKLYLFCCDGCLDLFKANPEKYLGGKPSRPDENRNWDEILHTCPMHPEIQKIGPGDCTLCGMALEPKGAVLEFGPSEELVEMKRRFWIGFFFTLPLWVVAMGPMFFSMHSRHLGHQEAGLGAGLLQWALATPVLFWAGWPLLKKAWASVAVRSPSPNMFTLIGLGTLASYALSMAELLRLLGIGEAGSGQGGLYFESTATIIVLVLLGQVLELKARSKTGQAIQALLRLTPEEALVIAPNGSETLKPLSAIKPGMHLRIRPGEKIPVDGCVVEGASQVNESMLTGEAMPVSKSHGDLLSAGTLNESGGLVMEARKVGSDTLLARLIQLVSHAQRSRAPIQRLADQVSEVFVPAVLGVSVLTFVVWFWFGPVPEAGPKALFALTNAVTNAIAVLVIACPCALGLATPMSIMVAMGRAASVGVLIKDAEVFETLGKIRVFVFDKTGTLTHGKLQVDSVLLAPQGKHQEKNTGISAEDQLVLRVASIEQGSEHPLAKAIVRSCKLPLLPHEKFHAVPGKGVEALLGQVRLRVGTRAYVEESGAKFGELETSIEELSARGLTPVFAAEDGRAIGVLGLADKIKEESYSVVETLKRLGLKTILLSGDRASVAQRVGRLVGVDQVIAECLPEDKLEVLKKLQREMGPVVMVGDGINDAPALAAADLGMAMGSGVDVALESAQVVLLNGNLKLVLTALELGKATVRNIRQNLFFAFFYNILGVPVAAGALYPFFGILLSPMLASASMSLSSVLVIGNALRLRRMR